MSNPVGIGTWPTPERIGILLVHGIGEQTRFQHLESEVRHLARAVQPHWTHGPVQTTVRAVTSSPYAAPQQTWEADKAAPVSIDLPGSNPKRIEVREVWWADLDEPAGYTTRVRFWLWGWSMWLLGGGKPPAPGAPLHLPAHAGGIHFWERLKLYLVGVVFMLLLGSLAFVQWVIQRVGVNIRITELLVAYVGDVKLYQQVRRSGEGPLTDLGGPPRMTVRRRMVQSLVDMALGGYDRWYVLAHSLGTVVAFNGLTEPDEVLARYLDERRWTAAATGGLTAYDPAAAVPPGLDATPPLPLWLRNGDQLLRSQVFAGLQGLLTYGSPLDKFATLWPRIVMRNGAGDTFPASFEWINVYDPTDPVAGALDNFGPPKGQAVAPQALPQPDNVPFKAGWLHLLSHIHYLTYRPGGRALVDVVAEWLVRGGAFPAPRTGGWRWPTPGGLMERLQVGLKYLVWAAVTLGAALLWLLWLPWAAKAVAWSVEQLFARLLDVSRFQHLGPADVWIPLALAAVLVFGVGLVARWFFR